MLYCYGDTAVTRYTIIFDNYQQGTEYRIKALKVISQKHC